MRNGNYLKRINLANNDMKNRRLHTMQKPVFFLMHESRYSFHLIMLSDLFLHNRIMNAIHSGRK
jgi:hypothetical protein